MGFIFIKELVRDIAIAEGLTYDAFIESKGLTVEEFEAMLAKGMQMDVGEFDFICNMTGMNKDAIINYCIARSLN